MDHSDKLKGYLEAAKILEAAQRELVHEPVAVFLMVNHAANYANTEAAKLLRGGE